MRQIIIVALGLCLVPWGAELRAQENGELMRTLQEMRARMDRMDQENQSLRDKLEVRDQQVEAMKERLDVMDEENESFRLAADDHRLEESINALTSRAFAPTTIHSVANPITLTGEFRFRFYTTAGADLSFIDNEEGSIISPGQEGEEDGDGTWVDARIRLGFLYEFTQDVRAFAEMQVHWGFGNGAPTSGGQQTPFEGIFVFSHGEASNEFNLYQGWLEMENLFGFQELTIRGGRQEIVLGNQFQFGNADWYNGWSFDAVRATWDNGCWRLNAFWITASSADFDRNQVPSFDKTHDDDELYVVYFDTDLGETHYLDVYWVYVNGHGGALDVGPKPSKPSVGSLGNGVGDILDVTGTTAYYHTVGARIGGVITGLADGLDWNLEGAIQFGEQNVLNADDVDTDGWTVEAEVGLTFNEMDRFRIYARALWASGPDSDSLGYVPLYPNRHSNGNIRARYGITDLFPMTNVISVQGGFMWDPAPEWTVGATILWATTENDLIPTVSDTDDDYGWELDAWCEYRYSDQLYWGAGLAVVFPDDEGEFLFGLQDDTFAMLYIQARLVF